MKCFLRRRLQNKFDSNRVGLKPALIDGRCVLNGSKEFVYAIRCQREILIPAVRWIRTVRPFTTVTCFKTVCKFKLNMGVATTKSFRFQRCAGKFRLTVSSKLNFSFKFAVGFSLTSFGSTRK